MRTQVVTSATGEPLSLDEIKDHLKIERGETAEDDILNAFISSAREDIEDYLGRKLLTQTWQVNFDKWPSDEYFKIPYPPLLGIYSSNLTYRDTNGAVNRVWSSADNQWEVDTVSEPGRLHLKYGEDWPSETLYNVNPITIKFICGYGTTDAGNASKVPAKMKLAIKLTAAHYYENRENTIVGQTIKEIPGNAKSLIYSARTWDHQM